MQQTQEIESIDRVLRYIQQDIETQERDDLIDDLIDVHTVLTTIKAKHIKKSHTISGDFHLYAYMVSQSLEMVFGEWESYTKVMDDRVIMYNDFFYMDINDENGPVECIVSFHHQSKPLIVAEAINTLKDIFGLGLKVSGEDFAINEASGEFIWGEDNIDQYTRNINGIKIKPMIFFDGDTIGNS